MFYYKNLEKYKEMLDNGFHLGYEFSKLEYIKMYKDEENYVFRLEDDLILEDMFHRIENGNWEIFKEEVVKYLTDKLGGTKYRSRQKRIEPCQKLYS